MATVSMTSESLTTSVGIKFADEIMSYPVLPPKRRGINSKAQASFGPTDQLTKTTAWHQSALEPGIQLFLTATRNPYTDECAV
ncbi:hypothetical protein CRX57_07430 [Pseudomonas putida]|uniref:Uncharacterized protein n=1 Tax=Pseudomonas putida TaxID=303 RepID=A0A2C5W755_PSEPU|nr:hypothetical protein CRX57_07430 [Pseudomonas putida]